MKIALIYPEYYDIAHFGAKRKEIPPFGVLYLTSILENHGHDASLFRVNSENYRLNLKSYEIVGYSFSSSVTYNLIRNSVLHSSYSKNVMLIAGGVHATFFPEEIINECGIDVVCLGEGESTILEIVNEYQSKHFDKINGIAYNKDGLIVKTKDRTLRKDLDSLPFPARHHLPSTDIVMDDRLADTSLKTVHILLTRGCTGKCFFCANQITKIRYRSGENVKDELSQLINDYGIEGFCIVDDNFVINKCKVIDICNKIKPLNLKWSSLSRVDTVSRELLSKMKDSGCIEIKYGIESGSQRILGAMNKKVKVEQIKKAINITHEIGINIKAFILHGFPGENIESTKETITLLESLRDKIGRISLFRFVPLPGSYVYRNHKYFNLSLPNSYDEIFIYNNEKQWWGNEKDKIELTKSYCLIKDYINNNWERY